ncbi:Protein of unknown function, partial [Gryllus bimaculatus]
METAAWAVDNATSDLPNLCNFEDNSNYLPAENESPAVDNCAFLTQPPSPLTPVSPVGLREILPEDNTLDNRAFLPDSSNADNAQGWRQNQFVAVNINRKLKEGTNYLQCLSVNLKIPSFKVNAVWVHLYCASMRNFKIIPSYYFCFLHLSQLPFFNVIYFNIFCIFNFLIKQNKTKHELLQVVRERRYKRALNSMNLQHSGFQVISTTFTAMKVCSYPIRYYRLRCENEIEVLVLKSFLGEVCKEG